MNNQHSLIEFENYRKSIFYVPEINSNSFYNIDNSEINILTKSNEPEFHLYTNKGIVKTGEGNFIVSYDTPYRNFTVIENTGVELTDTFTINNTSVEIFGEFIFKENSNLNITTGLLKLNSKSRIDLTRQNISINLNSSKIRINGRIKISYNNLSILDNPDIIINPSCEIDVTDLEYPNRIYSLSNFEFDLRDKIINPNTNGEYNNQYGRIGYTWVEGDLSINSKILKLSVLHGDSILGDFKFRTLGLQSKLVKDKQFISDIYISKTSTLYISEEYEGHHYYNPELYLGFVLFNFKRSATCVIDGTIIVDGNNSKISLDIESSIIINGSLIITNGGKLINANQYNKNKCIYINGELIIDDIEQLVNFHKDNFVFGEKGKLIIFNPTRVERRILLSIPEGIKTSQLYNLFKDNLNQVEYHIHSNTGIKIDKYYDFYNRELVDWYNGMRIEKAIHEGLIVWHNGGFIELSNDIIPWVGTDCNLLHAAKLFKSSKSFDKDILQEVVERLLYVGCGNIIFIFIKGNKMKELELNLQPVKINSIYNLPLSDTYVIESDNYGSLFIRNQVENTTSDNIINELSKHIIVNNNKTEFEIK